MSEEANDLHRPEPRAARSPEPPRETTAAVLPFPSNGVVDRRDGPVGPPRLRDVVGDVLRDERRRQARTLADVAERAAVSVPYLSEVERGRKEVSSDLLDAIGTALDLPLREILVRAAERLRTDVRTVEMSIGSGQVVGRCTTRFRLAA